MSYHKQYEERANGTTRWLVFDGSHTCRAIVPTEEEADEIIRHAEAVDAGEMNIMLIPRDPDVS